MSELTLREFSDCESDDQGDLQFIEPVDPTVEESAEKASSKQSLERCFNRFRIYAGGSSFFTNSSFSSY
jgi:hypothetical protein